jgi:DNA-binding Lrp family transcriptional regulator
MEAYIFVDCEPRRVWQIVEETLKIEGIRRAHAVTGQFDVVAQAEFANIDVLREIIDRLGSLDGVQRTHTAVAIPPRLDG